jgi:hypothetical protein
MMARKAAVKLKRQRRHPGHTRKRLTGAAEDVIDRAVRREAARFGCSVSFVVANCCAVALGIELGADETYKPVTVLRVIQGGRQGKRTG